jgi:lipid-binding SYLF domain-containing protein
MRKPLYPAFLLIVVMAVTACAQNRPPLNEAEALVERSRVTVEEFKERLKPPGQTLRANLKTARGVLIFPDVFKAAVGIGGQGGKGVLLARNEAGEWSYPAFYNMGGGSIGLQLGASSARFIFVLRSEEAVKSVINNQFQVGGDAQWTLGNLGSGYVAATTTNVGADVVGFMIAEGVFAGAAIQSGAIVRRNDLNQAYYTPDATPQGIVIDRAFWNVQADPLRKALVVE